MARLRRKSPLGRDESGDLDFAMRPIPAKDQPSRTRSSPRKQTRKVYDDAITSSCDEKDRSTELVPKASSRRVGRPKQIQLAPLNTTSSPRRRLGDFASLEAVRKSRSPVKSQSAILSDPIAIPTSTERFSHGTEPEASDHATEHEVEESIWCGSDTSASITEDDLPSARKLLSLRRPINNAPVRIQPAVVSDSFERSLARARVLSEKAADIPSRPTSSSDKENGAAFLRFSPPRLYSMPRARGTERPVTPPQSPSKSRLQSPSKTRPRVPTPLLRESLDAFWNAGAVNDWNDQYSPQKILRSPKKINFIRAQRSESPTASPRKSQSPTKAERETKKTFESSKHHLAAAFLAELDSTVTNGELGKLAETTGGVQFIWSKTLNSTAGRANWRKETTKTTKADGTVVISHKHHASIELAEKVINDEHRLLNVIAHEFCHLANFMISGIKDQPHGRQFKDWGSKCTKAFGHRGVEVTTKHSYQIEYKYVWQCSNEDCAVEFKRHSKSIDPKRHTCGSCRSKLIQIRPAPRKDAGTASGYAAFVKMHFALVKRGMPGASQKEVMEAVGRKYRAEKAAKDGVVESRKTSGSSLENAIDLDAVARELEVVRLDDD